MAERKANVYATLVKLQEEVTKITEITEMLKDADNIKDSKTFVEEIKKEFGVRAQYSVEFIVTFQLNNAFFFTFAILV